MNRLEVDASEADPGQLAGTVKSLVVPRPIAWVSSLSSTGVCNLAPHSFFTMASEQPAIAQFTSIGAKDSLQNVRETGEFVINVASEPDFELVNATGTDYPHGIDEFEAVGIAAEPSARVSPPRVASSPAALECRLIDTIEVGGGTIVLGEVVHVAITESVLTEGRADIELLRPLSRLGGNQWGLLGEIREIRRVAYEELP